MMQITKHSITEPQSAIAADIAFHSLGDASKPMVLCVHGLTRNAKDFYPLAESLAADYYVVMPDMPGRGHSPNFENPMLYNNMLYAGLLAEWLTQEAGDVPVHWVGTSMGGIIGMIIAATRPKLIGSLLLNDIGSMIPEAAIDKIKSYVGLASTHDDYDALASTVREALQPFGIEDAAILQQFVESSIKPAAGGGYQLTCDPAIRQDFLTIPPGDVDLSELWGAILQPTMVIRGEHSGLLLRETAHAMQASRPDVDYLEVPRAGHAPSLTRPEELKAIGRWLGGQAASDVIDPRQE